MIEGGKDTRDEFRILDGERERHGHEQKRRDENRYSVPLNCHSPLESRETCSSRLRDLLTSLPNTLQRSAVAGKALIIPGFAGDTIYRDCSNNTEDACGR